jgi:hypothetical protein
MNYSLILIYFVKYFKKLPFFTFKLDYAKP